MEKELKEIYECPTMEVVEIRAEDYIPNASTIRKYCLSLRGFS
jgi:hypothetical protein